MNNNTVLTDAEFDAYQPFHALVQRLEQCRQRLGLEREAFRVVDWGCGRGLFVLWLLEQGYDARGVDVDARSFARGSDAFRRKGRVLDECLFALDARGRAPLPDGVAHFVSSWQTLEHVADLARVAMEMRRVTAPGGAGCHVFPPHLTPVELHLGMPYVHWVPKGPLRRLAIWAALSRGHDPQWWPNQPRPRAQQVNDYTAFSRRETFYRSPLAIIKCFATHGWEAEFFAVDQHPPESLQGSPRLLAWWHRHFAAGIGLATRAR